ncbi:MAG: peptidoglycan DD-metalloendopeptidase family protein [Solobacterium sp.]|nr:peptidoglycan DD-metalloendopeptidase family protein [Solobacterium sp.]
MKRLIRALLAVSLAAMCLPGIFAYAEPDYSDEEYWTDRCLGKSEMSPEDKAACTAYAQYLSKQNTDLGKQFAAVEAKRKQYEEDIAAYAAEIAGYQTQIDAKQAEIDAKQLEIDAKQAEIDAKQAEIDAKQAEIDAKQAEIKKKEEEIGIKETEIADTEAEVEAEKSKVKSRMVIEQRTMRINPYIDILMGAETLDSLVRIMNGLTAISKYDQKVMDSMLTLIDKLNLQKQELEGIKSAMEEVKKQMESVKTAMEAVKAEMETAKGELDKQQEEMKKEKGNLLALQYEIQLAEQVAENMRAELEAQGNKIAADIEAKNQQMREIAEAGVLDEVVATASAGWTYPVPGSRRSAGTWYYPGGGVHLGYDFAAPAGSPIYAVGNGIIINSANGCPTYGYLGSGCGYQYGGSSGGGNQVYLLTPINDGLYAVKYLHMMINSPIATGTRVFAGDQIGQVGSSGNSSGPHCHIEIFYLGSADNFSNFAQTWNGDLAFGCGWAYAALNRRCESGVGAPCRIRPETVFD